MINEEKISTLKFEIYATLLYSILFFVIVLLLFTGMVYTGFFSVVLYSPAGYAYISILSIMLVATLIEIIHIYSMYSNIKNNNIKKLVKINSMKYAIPAVFFSGLITGLLLLFINNSIKEL